MQGKETRGKGPGGSWPSWPPEPPGCCVSSPHPSFSPPSPPASPPPPLWYLEVLQVLTALLKRPVGQALGCLLSGLASSSFPPLYLNLRLLLPLLLASAENTAKRHEQNNGMTERLPKTQNIHRLPKSPGVKMMTGFNIVPGSKIMIIFKLFTGSQIWILLEIAGSGWKLQ